jgi:hypothetical protein
MPRKPGALFLTLHRRTNPPHFVAWVKEHFPETRNNDALLQLEY